MRIEGNLWDIVYHSNMASSVSVLLTGHHPYSSNVKGDHASVLPSLQRPRGEPRIEWSISPCFWGRCTIHQNVEILEAYAFELNSRSKEFGTLQNF